MPEDKKFYSFYNSIMNIDEKVRYVAIIQKSGNVVFEGQKEGIKNCISDKNQIKTIKHVCDVWFLRDQFSEEIGMGKFAMAEYEKIIRFSFPINPNFFLFITTEKEIDSCEFVDNILKIKESHYDRC